MMDAPLLLSICVFLVCFLTILAAFSYADLRKSVKLWRKRAEGTAAGGFLDQLRQAGHRLRTIVVEALAQVGHVSKPKDEVGLSDLRKSLITAGYRNPTDPITFLGAKLSLALILPLILLAFRSDSIRLLPASTMIFLYVMLAAAGFYAPHLWLRLQTSRRKQKLLDGFPDALDLIVVCVEAGMGLGAAIARVGDELKLAHKELSDEFHLLAIELRTGLSRQQALRNLGIRSDLDDVKSLAAMLIQTDRFGTSVGSALKVYSESMRKNRYFRAEEEAAKLPVKMLFPMIFFIFPSFFVVILGPAVIRIFKTVLPTLTK